MKKAAYFDRSKHIKCQNMIEEFLVCNNQSDMKNLFIVIECSSWSLFGQNTNTVSISRLTGRQIIIKNQSHFDPRCALVLFSLLK